MLCGKTSHWFKQLTKILAFDNASSHVSEIFHYSVKKKSILNPLKSILSLPQVLRRHT